MAMEEAEKLRREEINERTELDRRLQEAGENIFNRAVFREGSADQESAVTSLLLWRTEHYPKEGKSENLLG